MNIKKIIKEELTRYLQEVRNESYRGEDDNGNFEVEIEIEYDADHRSAIKWKAVQKGFGGEPNVLAKGEASNDRELNAFSKQMYKLKKKISDENEDMSYDFGEAAQRAAEEFKEEQLY